jgi:hypothetical protein
MHQLGYLYFLSYIWAVQIVTAAAKAQGMSSTGNVKPAVLRTRRFRKESNRGSVS